MTTKKRNIIIGNAVLCEDIRQERSNKFILIGVFSSDMLIEKLPCSVPLAFFLEAVVRKRGQTSLAIKLSGPGEGEFVLRAVLTTTRDNENVSMPLPRAEVLLECEGTFRLAVSEDEANWTTVIEKKVTQQDGLWTLHPIALRQPSEQSQPAVPAS